MTVINKVIRYNPSTDTDVEYPIIDATALHSDTIVTSLTSESTNQ